MSKLGVLFWRLIFELGDAKRLSKQKQDTGDLHIVRDISYINDGKRGHLLDIYELPGLPDNAPVLVNIHGGGLFASYKEVNANFNYEWTRMGYRVVSLSYRRIPETTLWHQIDDVMAALRFLKAHAGDYHLDLDRCILTGDSAGALLSLFVLSINNSRTLQQEFGIESPEIPFRAAGLISIMLDTQRNDLIRAVSDVVTNRDDRGKPYEKYLLDPSLLIGGLAYPPLFLVTSAEDMIRADTLKLDKLLTGIGCSYELLNFPQGVEHELVHVFAVCYPMYPESREVFMKMNGFFREAL